MLIYNLKICHHLRSIDCEQTWPVIPIQFTKTFCHEMDMVSHPLTVISTITEPITMVQEQALHEGSYRSVQANQSQDSGYFLKKLSVFQTPTSAPTCNCT